MQKLLIVLWASMMLLKLTAQEKIEVAELTLKLESKKEEILYYGFATGDKIILNVEEATGKTITEVEVIEYPENKKFQDYESKSIKDKVINVITEGVYVFRFYNKGGDRICRVHIQRIPATASTVAFNTGIQWVEKNDTTFNSKTKNVTVGYTTVQVPSTRRVIASIDTNVVTIVDRVERVHSTTNANGNVSNILFELPRNTYEPNELFPMKQTEVVGWAYSLATGETGAAWYKDADSKAFATKATTSAVSAGLISSGYGALAVLAIEGLSLFSSPPKGDNVKFYIKTAIQGNVLDIGNGNSVVASGRIADYKQGGFAFQLVNDNIMDGINVDVKVIAITVTTTWKNEDYMQTKSVPVKESKTTNTPKKISTTKIPQLIKN